MDELKDNDLLDCPVCGNGKLNGNLVKTEWQKKDQELFEKERLLNLKERELFEKFEDRKHLSCRVTDLENRLQEEERKNRVLKAMLSGNVNRELSDDIQQFEIIDLDLSLRAYNCLKSAGIKTVGHIIEEGGLNSLRGVRNFGVKSLREVSDALLRIGVPAEFTTFEAPKKGGTTGWICIKCGRCNAPSSHVCSCVSSPVVTITTVDPPY